MKAEWRLRPVHKEILEALEARPMHDGEIARTVVGKATVTAIARAVDELARRGLIADTGERGPWTSKGRMIVWRKA